MNDSLKTNILPARRPHRAAWKALFVVAVMIASSMVAVGTASAAVCSITVNTPNVTPLHVDYDGTATYNGPQDNIFSFTVDWGDGSAIEDIPVQADPFNWTASHDYADAGAYTVSIAMIHAQPQGQDTCAGAYSENVEVPPPAEVCGNGIDDNGDGQVDEGCVTPPPPPPASEICNNGIDDNGDGLVDENCNQGGGNTGGGSTGGTTTGGSTQSGDTKVLAKNVSQAPLATTGAATTAAAWIGAMLLMLGLAMRFVRPRPVSAVFAGQGSAAAEIERFGLNLQAQSARRWFRR